MSIPLWTLFEGDSPLVIDVPHAGHWIPPELRAGMTPVAQTLPDTDWHVHLLYEFALQQGASLMVATHSRYVIDLNRDPQNAALYPDADNTELCPTKTFEREDIYLPGHAPGRDEIEARRSQYWVPYQMQLAGLLQRVRARHGYAILLDAHSIRSVLPRFFEGRLPHLNLGSADGASCMPSLQQLAAQALQSTRGYSSVVNGRFKGGYITRRYGQPGQRVHALQLEIAQDAYMREGPPYAWAPALAAPLQRALAHLVSELLGWRA